MRKAISTYVFIKGRLHPGMLDKLLHSGAETVELFAARSHFDYTDRAQVREIANWSKFNNVPINSIHAPMYSQYEWRNDGGPPINLVDRDKRRRVEAMDEIKRTLEVAEQAPFRFLVQHLGAGDEEYDDHKFEWALSALEHLHTFAKPLGVKVLIENIPNEIATPQKLHEIIETLHIPDLGVCFDFGHAHCTVGVPEAFALLRPHIRSTHVHDNHKEKDEHLFPGEGTIDWNEAMALLRTAPHVPPVLLEINGEGRKDIFDKYQESFRKLELAAEAAGKSQ